MKRLVGILTAGLILITAFSGCKSTDSSLTNSDIIITSQDAIATDSTVTSSNEEAVSKPAESSKPLTVKPPAESSTPPVSEADKRKELFDKLSPKQSVKVRNQVVDWLLSDSKESEKKLYTREEAEKLFTSESPDL